MSGDILDEQGTGCEVAGVNNGGVGTCEQVPTPPKRQCTDCSLELRDDRVCHLRGTDGSRIGAVRLHVVGDILAFGDHC